VCPGPDEAADTVGDASGDAVAADAVAADAAPTPAASTRPDTSDPRAATILMFFMSAELRIWSPPPGKLIHHTEGGVT
jgi:hypothetical protein